MCTILAKVARLCETGSNSSVELCQKEGSLIGFIIHNHGRI